MVEVGQKAPVFSLYNTEKNKISLDSFSGKNIVLLFFPLAFSSGCTKELCSIRDDSSTYNNLNALILGISVDSVYTLKKFREEQHLSFNLLSDFNKEVSRTYQSLYDTFSLDMKGVSKRSVFVLDKELVIRHKEILEDAGQLPDFDAVKKVLNAIA